MSNAELRRLPWAHDGKVAYVTPGDGPVNAMADQMERLAVETARDLSVECGRMARDMAVPEDALRRALVSLAAITQDVVQVADLRGERLASGQ